ncbi:hypothetical protein M3204_03210 [Mesobacillus subterraneus]|jgi:hypothetical protein|uniref:hypothetical protein n=1 Tax=Mesobacillus subterraneus TaxID=285983 RepID=UPI00203BBC07|nr:hypothetical protein [Mesobacillus subterraneus]MCM3663399.1 hypothetical protein [Mesobacillus subterraneus]MCM3683170.1 hypothetical protein [Mesobacillus subterraneus]
MVDSILEFRGINREHLGMYFEELGGRLVSDSFPFVYEADSWRAEILSEDELAFTKTFIVNAVHIRFAAESLEDLEQLIKNYRYKTTRVGG